MASWQAKRLAPAFAIAYRLPLLGWQRLAVDDILI
jgi:hypothetical protein